MIKLICMGAFPDILQGWEVLKIGILLNYDAPIKYIDGSKISIYSDWVHPANSYSSYTLICVLKGTLYLLCGDKKSEVSAGQILIIPPDTTYGSYRISKDALSFFWCRFTMPDHSGSVKYKLKSNLSISSSFIAPTVIKELSAKSGDNSCDEYLSFLLTTLLYSFTSSSCKVEQPIQDNFSRILSYIDENISSSLGASAIAEHFGYNPAYFSRLFFKKTGQSPMEYIKTQRIYLAKELLVRPYDTIREIALACGYPDEKYFSRLFKKSEGVTPTQYRRANGQTD